MSIQPGGPQVPNTAEPVPVQLTRIEGVINLIAYQQGEMRDDVKELRADLTGTIGRVQALEHQLASTAGASMTWRTWLPIIAAIASTVIAAVALSAL